MSPAFPTRTLLLLIIPVALAVIILAAVGKRGTGVFKKQGVAWGLTVLMVFAAIGIGYAKASSHNPAPSPDYPSETIPAAAGSYVWDDAYVLSSQAERELDQRNDRLWDRYSVSIGVVTCNYGRDSLGDYARQCAESMGLGGYDMIVVLDISGDNYWLLLGDDLTDDCSDYAYEYMERWFAQGDYDNAVLSLTEALEVWYGDHY